MIYLSTKRNVPWHILAERFYMIGRNFLSYKKAPEEQISGSHKLIKLYDYTIKQALTALP